MPNDFTSVNYQVQIRRKRKTIASKTTKSGTRRRVTFKNIASGKYLARYRIAVPGGGFTTFSRGRSFRVK